MRKLIEELGNVIDGKVLTEGVGGGFDTKMRRAIEHSADQLKSLGKKKDDPKARKAEDDVISGLQRMVKGDPVKFLYSVLEILGVRGKYESQRYGAKSEEISSDPLVEAQRLLDEETKTEDTIKALRDTDYRDKDAFFKMAQLIKGLAVASEEEDLAKKFMSAVSDAMTTAAKKVLGDEGDES